MFGVWLALCCALNRQLCGGLACPTLSMDKTLVLPRRSEVKAQVEVSCRLSSQHRRLPTHRTRRRSRLLNRIRFFVNHQMVAHEILVIAISYLFVAAGLWNDRVLGLAPTPYSRLAELLLAAALALEIISRLEFTYERPAGFWILIAADVTSILTIFPAIKFVALLRLFRTLYASARLVGLLDCLACKYKNPLYLIGIYPLVVPAVSAVVYAVERNVNGSPIKTYFDALSVCFTFALTLGNVRPESPISMGLCGILFLAGIVCIGILTNAISARYSGEANA